MLVQTPEKNLNLPSLPAIIKVLLVDNDEDDYILTKHVVEEITDVSIELEWVATFEVGLEAVARRQHHAYLVDYRLEGEYTGLDLIRQAINLGCQVPLIFLTGQGDRNLDLEAMSVGAADYLAKDQIEPALLERTIRHAIERKRAEVNLQRTYKILEQRIIERTVELAKANASLKENISELEKLKQQIQKSLERRTTQVELSTQIAQEIAMAPALDTLFQMVVNQVQEKFGYYHVHVYTLENGYLVMQEGTGDAGRMMKEVGHKIALHATKSLIARAARSGEPVLVADVFQESGWLPNLLLAETKSEIAVPIKLRDEVLGVLDVQQDVVGDLSLEDQILLMGLCGQIAVAINNQRLEMERRQAEEAQKKLIEELDAFGYTVGHNLKEPLSLIIGYTSLLKEVARLPEELQEYLNAIARNGYKINNIIEELQLLAGLRKEEVELKPLNTARIIAEVQQRLAFMINEYQAKIIISEYWPVALGHTPWVEEIWANYIGNAIKYGGTPPRVHVGATAQSDGMIRFWVRDNGPGLNLAEQSQLFTEFSRISQLDPKDRGLGLSIVRRIVTRLGGEVGVTSDGLPGHGCIFTFTLPSLGLNNQ